MLGGCGRNSTLDSCNSWLQFQIRLCREACVTSSLAFLEMDPRKIKNNSCERFHVSATSPRFRQDTGVSRGKPRVAVTLLPTFNAFSEDISVSGPADRSHCFGPLC